MAKKQTQEIVSEAADNTRVLKQTKNIMKLVVRNVKFSTGFQNVKFIAKNQRGGVVICRTKGQPPIRVKFCDAYKKPHFEASIRGNSVVPIGKTPNQAFARAVKEFWA